MTVAVVTFPGSNCDRDCVHVVEHAVGESAHRVWHKDAALPADTHAVLLPGGFSYGDSLRAGAIAAHSPILGAIRRFAERGGPVLGICNGFQILCETRMLPGALLQNESGLFQCEVVELEVTGGGVGMLREYAPGERITLPIAHAEGNYYADEQTLAALEREGCIALRYTRVRADGSAVVNGARRAVAGLLGGPAKNILGLMPHPERRAEPRLGGDDGLRLLRGLCAARA